MPSARGRETLPPILLKYLATGDYDDPDAPPGGRLGTGAWEAFILDGQWLRWSRNPETWPHLAGVVDELQRLWEQHHDEIESATPPGWAPYCYAQLVEAWRLLGRGGEEEMSNP